MMFLPLRIFTVLFLGFPSGLVIYWLVNNMSIFQQWLMMRKNKAAARRGVEQFRCRGRRFTIELCNISIEKRCKNVEPRGRLPANPCRVLCRRPFVEKAMRDFKDAPVLL